MRTSVNNRPIAYNFLIFFVYVTFLSTLVLLTFGKGNIEYLLRVAVISFLFLSLLNIEWAVLLFILVAPFQFLIRRYSMDYIPLSLWREYLYIILMFCYFLYLSIGRLRFPRESNNAIILFFNAIGIIGIILAPSLMVGLAGFKETVRFSGIYIVIYSLLKDNPNRSTRFIYTIVIGGLITAFIQAYGYFTNAKIVVDIFTPLVRSVFGLPIHRMGSIVLGGPASMGRFLAALAIMCLCINLKKQKGALLWFLAFLFLTCMSILSTSQTALLALVVGLLSINLGYQSPKPSLIKVKKILTFLLFVAVVIIYLKPRFWLGLEDLYLRGMGMVDYWKGIMPETFASFLLGNGFRTGSAILTERMAYEYMDVTTMVDWGWSGLIYQMGFPVAVLMFIFTFINPIKGIVSMRINPKYEFNPILLIACAGMLSFSMYVHMVPWSSPGPDIYIFVLAAIVNYLRKNIPS